MAYKTGTGTVELRHIRAGIIPVHITNNYSIATYPPPLANLKRIGWISIDECISLESSLPYFKDAASGALYTSGRYAAEYNFWLEFFKDSTTLLTEFKERVSDAPRGFIKWDFIRPGDPTLSGQSMAEQYREALNFVRDCLKGTSHVIKNLENLKRLEKLADQVIENRENQLEIHKNDGNIRVQEIHKDIHRRWIEVREAIADALSKLR